MGTVVRGEITAYVHHLTDLGPHGQYVGDCAMVIRYAREGVPAQARSSSNINADLWQEVHRLQLDRGISQSSARKTKAHRARAAAEADRDDPVELWEGNKMADQSAKELAHFTATNSTGYADLMRSREESLQPITRAALAVTWNLKLWPYLGQTKNKKRRRITRDGGEDTNGHQLESRETNAWECTRCRLWARGQQGKRTLFRHPCKGRLCNAAHESHIVIQHEGVLWCRRCGAYSTRLLRNLLKPCPGTPASEAQRNVRRRLHAGLTPTTAAYLSADRTTQRQRHYDDNRDVSTDIINIIDNHNGDEDHVMSEINARRTRRRSIMEHAALGEPAGTFKGVYLRLPGGPHHRGQQGRSETSARDNAETTLTDTSDALPQARGSGGGTLSTTQSCNSRAISAADTANVAQPGICRRRIRQKMNVRSYATPPTVAPGPFIERRVPFCTPTTEDPWTRRITVVSGGGLAASFKCSLCQNGCRTICRGCDSAICSTCARTRRHCIAHSRHRDEQDAASTA